MAHEKVERRSISNKEWSDLMLKKIKDFIVIDHKKIEDWQVREGIYSPDGYLWDDEEYSAISENELWGGPDTTAVFKTEVKIPDSYNGQTVYFYMLAACEVMVKVNGAYQGGIDPNRDRFLLSEKAVSGQVYQLEMEAYTRSKPDDDRSQMVNKMKGCAHPFLQPELIIIDDDMLSLSYDVQVLYETVYSELMDEGAKDYLESLLKQLIKLLPLYEADSNTFRAAIPKVKEFLKENVYGKNHPYGKNGKLACIAYSHLDIAYHWKVAQTVQKNARTVLIQLRLMDKYKDFIFAHTQAWTYEMLEKYYPELFEEVKAKVKSGQWEIMGGLYVEPDCNLISAESYVRQIVYGKNYFKEKFDVNVDNCWLPDVFGNSPIMPQILKKGGIDYFVSNKMSTWNDTNRFPYNNFMWRGLDGSEVYACVPPTHFISWAEPDQAIGHWESFQNKDICDESLQMYGYGDGGSGVTEEMLEFYKRQEQLPIIPKQRLTTGKEYLHTTFKQEEKFPVWEGDLYLEMHRGTFTTKGAMKLANRKGEYGLGEIEYRLVLSKLMNGKTKLSSDKTKNTWKKLLLNQFHDIIPGSHTTAVAKEAMVLYDEIDTEINEYSGLLNSELIVQDKRKLTFSNTFGVDRKGIAFLECESLNLSEIGYESQGLYHQSQKMCDPNGVEKIAIETAYMQKLSSYEVEIQESRNQELKSPMIISKDVMENDFYRVESNESGQLTRVYDKIANKEVIETNKLGNEFQLFDDRPGVYNAWDIVDNYEDYPIQIEGGVTKEIVENGPISIGIKVTREMNNSRYIQVIRLFAKHRRIDFQTWVDWREDQKLLKVAFPLTFKGTHYLVDTSAGVLSHINNKNTTWQQAKFEVPCHKWVEMSAGYLGAAIINDSKYGCDVQGNVMRLSLLRAPIRPDRHSDRGEHVFTYSLFTHDGNWQRSPLIEEALNVNWPIKAYVGGMINPLMEESLIQIDNNDLVIQSIKIAEDNTDDIIIRLVEVKESFGVCSLRPTFDYKTVCLCDLLEQKTEEVNLEELSYRTFDIITLRFTR